jgi:hypothetical protein
MSLAPFDVLLRNRTLVDGSGTVGLADLETPGDRRLVALFDRVSGGSSGILAYIGLAVALR